MALKSIECHSLFCPSYCPPFSFRTTATPVSPPFNQQSTHCNFLPPPLSTSFHRAPYKPRSSSPNEPRSELRNQYKPQDHQQLQQPQFSQPIPPPPGYTPLPPATREFVQTPWTGYQWHTPPNMPPPPPRPPSSTATKFLFQRSTTSSIVRATEQTSMATLPRLIPFPVHTWPGGVILQFATPPSLPL